MRKVVKVHFIAPVGRCQPKLLDLLADKRLLESLAKEKYDVAVAEAYDICLFGIFHALNIPTKIATLAIHMSEPLTNILGIPSPPSFVPGLRTQPNLRN